MFSLREYRKPSGRLPDYLPWAGMVAPGVVLGKDGTLQKTFAFRGPDLATAAPSAVMAAVARCNNALKRLGSGWAIWVEAQRYRCEPVQLKTFSNRAATLVEAERQERSFKVPRYDSSFYLTFVYQIPSDNARRVTALFWHDPQGTKASVSAEKALAYFESRVEETVGLMNDGFVDSAPLSDDETLGYLHSTVSTNRHPVRMPEVPFYLDALLPDQAFTPGAVPMLGDNYLPTVTVAGYPQSTFPAILSELNHLEIEYRWVNRFICLDSQDARTEIEAYRARWWQRRKGIAGMLREVITQEQSALVDNAAANKATEADGALQALGADDVAFGYLTTTVTVWDRDLAQARAKIVQVKQAIQSQGFVVRDETLNAREAWLGSLPGHVYPNVRRPIVNTLNLAHVLPLSADWTGERQNEHLHAVTGDGSVHVEATSVGRTPFHLNLNVGDVGHTLIIGPTGAGKSSLLALLELQWLRYPGAQVYIFDRDRSARAATLAVGGPVYEPGNPKRPVAFQPLRFIDQPAERIWAAKFCRDLIAAQGVSLSPDEGKQIDDALLTLAADKDANRRTITILSNLVQSTAMRAALRPYTLEGNHGQLFDANSDSIAISAWAMFEMGALMSMGPDVVVPALSYLFHRVEQRFDGRPTLLVLDEAWLFLSHPVFSAQLQAWLKTLRKKNVYVLCATQELADARQSAIMPTLLEATATKIYLPNEEATTRAVADTYRYFGLSDEEIQLLASSQKKRHYYYRSTRGRRLFELEMGPVALAFCGMSSPADHAFLDTIEALPVAERIAEMLRYRGLDVDGRRKR